MLFIALLWLMVCIETRFYHFYLDKKFASASLDGSVIIWNSDDLKVVSSFKISLDGSVVHLDIEERKKEASAKSSNNFEKLKTRLNIINSV